METTIILPKGYHAVHRPEINDSYFAVYHNEIGFNGQNYQIWVAGFNEVTKVARPCHGYFPPHKTGIKMGEFFKKIGFSWDYS